MVDSQMELTPGVAVMAMVLDTLSERTPLYRLKEFFQEKDVELILGQNVSPAPFCDYNVGGVLDKILEPEAFVYVADSAFVTPDTFQKVTSGSFYRRADAQAAADKITNAACGSYHIEQYEINKEAKFPR